MQKKKIFFLLHFYYNETIMSENYNELLNSTAFLYN